ncbi:MAG: prepilin-type N-terminal cleavage/methylation domain-containing protein [Vicinamibacterales bacterium]
MKKRMARSDCGFSLVEMLVATAITATVTALACGLAVEAHHVWRVDGSRVDVQQRVRVAADVLTRALLESGAGAHAGPGKGPLVRFLPPLIPRRTGRRGADPPATFRSDALTVVRVVAEAEHGVLRLPVAPGDTAIEIAPAPTCDLPACGFVEGAVALLLDDTGNHDLFTVLGVSGQALSLRHHGGGAHAAYQAGSPVLVAEVSTYYFDRETRILRRYDGDDSDLPLMDDVVDLELEYYGEPRPPARPRPASGVSNCLYETDGSYRAALLPVLPGVGGSEARLTDAVLTDGPWCGSGPNQFDADLLRVRRVRATVRLQASDPSVRGADPARFRVPGFGRRSALLVSDANVVIDVTPRNLRSGW